MGQVKHLNNKFRLPQFTFLDIINPTLNSSTLLSPTYMYVCVYIRILIENKLGDLMLSLDNRKQDNKEKEVGYKEGKTRR